MARVDVYGGDLEAALVEFKKAAGKEGIMGEYKRRLSFTPAHKERKQKEYIAEMRRKNRAQRKQLRREAAKRRKDN